MSSEENNFSYSFKPLYFDSNLKQRNKHNLKLTGNIEKNKIIFKRCGRSFDLFMASKGSDLNIH